MPKTEYQTQELMERATRDAKMAERGCIPIPEAAKRLKLSPARTYALADSGDLTLKKLGGAVYVTVKSVEAYEAANTVTPNLLSVAQANKKYGYSRVTLFRYIREGKLHPTYIKRFLYFDKAELDWQLLGKGEPPKAGDAAKRSKK